MMSWTVWSASAKSKLVRHEKPVALGNIQEQDGRDFADLAGSVPKSDLMMGWQGIR